MTDLNQYSTIAKRHNEKKGFMKIANNISELLDFGIFTNNERRVIGAILRFTSGYNRLYANLSNRTISEKTNIKLQTVSTIKAELLRNSVILEYKETKGNQPKIIGFNFDFNNWQGKYKKGVTKYLNTLKKELKGDDKEGLLGENLEPPLKKIDKKNAVNYNDMRIETEILDMYDRYKLDLFDYKPTPEEFIRVFNELQTPYGYDKARKIIIDGLQHRHLKNIPAVLSSIKSENGKPRLLECYEL